MKINVMTPETAVLAAQLEARCFNDPWSEDSFVNILSNQHARYYTLCIDDTLVGYIGMFDLVDEVSIINVAVDPNHRGKGYGTVLMESAETFALERGCPSITLEVRETNLPARTLYEKQGYQIFGKQKNYYTNPKEDAVLYRKAVK